MSNMEDLVESLTSNFQVTGDRLASSASAGHPHFSSYKNRGLLAERQAQRRQEFLESQKSKRFAALTLVRHLEGVEIDEIDDVEFANEPGQSPATSPDSQKSRGRRAANPFRNQLMCSEWLVHVPENVADEWLMVPCPEGKRVLVVAANGTTKAYLKSGFMVKEFRSALPGNVGEMKGGYAKATVLDCVYSEKDGIFYGLDIISWNGCPVFDSETEFRFFWLKSKLDENPELFEANEKNNYAFKLLEWCKCNREDMEAMMRQTFSFKLDGVLFYHKGAHYMAGQTPLIGWLKPFMLPEILGVNVPAEFMAGKENTTTLDYIAEFDEKYEKKHGGRQYGGKKKADSQMDTEDEKVDESMD